MPGSIVRLLGLVVAVLLLFSSHAYAESYEYDPAGRLTSVTYDDGTAISYTYDANGNILSKHVTGGIATNQPPLPFDLVYPADGAVDVPTGPNFIWKETTDPDGDMVSYALTVCEDQAFTGCDPVTVAALDRPTDWQLAGFGTGWWGLGLLGLVFIARRRRRARDLALPFALATLLVLPACKDDKTGNNTNGMTQNGVTADMGSNGGNNDGGGGGGDTGGDTGGGQPTAGPGELDYTLPNLTAGTTYYWKVAASDGNGGVTESDVWSFTTEVL